MNRIAQKSIRRVYYAGSITSVLLAILTVTLFFTHNFTTYHTENIDQLATGIINEKKRFIKNAVERTIYLIESERNYVVHENSGLNLPQDQIENIVLKRVKPIIRNQRLIDDGYIWVNRIVDYEGGKRYAIREIHPNLPETEGSWLSTETTDIKGNHPYKTELDGIKSNGELYFDYYFKRLNSGHISHKLSYAKLYKRYDWVIATGVYLDDVNELIEAETKTMIRSYRHTLTIALILFFLVMMISLYVLMVFERKIQALLDRQNTEIKKQNIEIHNEHEKVVKALAEVRQLKGMLPICSQCKKIRDDNGYWNQIESYIKMHTDASFTHGYCPECYAKEVERIKAWKETGTDRDQTD